jgi:hypothetical protein
MIQCDSHFQDKHLVMESFNWVHKSIRNSSPRNRRSDPSTFPNESMTTRSSTHEILSKKTIEPEVFDIALFKFCNEKTLTTTLQF